MRSGGIANRTAVSRNVRSGISSLARNLPQRRLRRRLQQHLS
jgi:hypothetical protein